MPVFPSLTVGQQVDRAKEQIGYLRARRKWVHERIEAGIPQALAAPEYSRLVEGPPFRLEPMRDSHVVVVPMEGPSFESYRPANFNLYYEAGQLLREDLGADAVSVFDVPPGERSASWHMRLIDHVMDTKATHVLTHIESDPGTQGQAWTWDVALAGLTRVWDGVLLGMLYDSSWDWIRAKPHLLAKMSSHFMAVDIAEPLAGRLVRGRFEVGPVNMPLSREAVAIIDDRLAGVTPEWDVSFIGVIYEYRVELIKQLRELGFSVAVNPHRPDRAEDPTTSRLNQPTWPDYMAALRSSRMTINFSQSNAGRYEQLKTRVIEATLAGTLLVTDDIDRTSRFWKEGEEYAYFATPVDLPRVTQRYIEDAALRDRVAKAGQVRAREIVHGYWSVVNDGLMRRGLPQVGRRPMN